MKYKYQITYEGNSYIANTAAEAVRILRFIDRYVDGYSVNFCSPACAGYYFLDIRESKLEIE